MSQSQRVALSVLLLVTVVSIDAQGGAHIGDPLEDFSDPGDLIVLDAKTFEQQIRTHTKDDRVLLVMFYAPWSNHSMEVMPVLKEAAAALKSQDPPLYIARMNTDPEDNRVIAQDAGVRAWPTFNLYESVDSYVLYTGGRSKDDFITVVNNVQGSAWTEVFSTEEIQAHVEVSERVVIFGGKQYGRDASSSWKTYTHVATKGKVTRDNVYLGAFKPELVEAAGIDPPAMQVITNYKGTGVQKKNMPAKLNISDANQVEKWISQAIKPRVAFSSNAVHARLLRDMGQLVLHVLVEDGSDTSAAHATLVEASSLGAVEDKMAALTSAGKGKVDPRLFAQQTWTELLYAVTEASDKVGAQLMEELGATVSDLPIVVGRRERAPMRSLLWRMEARELPSSADLHAFANDVVGGITPRFIKSDPLPDPPTKKEPAQVVVADNFNEVVMDNSSHVLIQFYAPWCKHSQKLEPEYRKLARKVFDLKAKKPEKYGNVVIAKMDASANDIPGHLGHLVTSYPSFFIVQAGENKVTAYKKKDRDWMELLKWLKQVTGLSKDAPKDPQTGKTEL